MRIRGKFLTPPWAKRRRLRKKSNGKKVSRPPQARKHCRNGALTRTAIGIRRKRKETKDRERQEGKENKGSKEDTEKRRQLFKIYQHLGVIASACEVIQEQHRKISPLTPGSPQSLRSFAMTSYLHIYQFIE